MISLSSNHCRVAGFLRYEFHDRFLCECRRTGRAYGNEFRHQNSVERYPNNYWSFLPFGTLMKKWPNDVSVTFSYKRTIQRPRLNELNPSTDYADPYNTRSGNPHLQAYFADNFDLIFGNGIRNTTLNASVGYNALQDIYSSIRTPAGRRKDVHHLAKHQRAKGIRRKYLGRLYLQQNPPSKTSVSGIPTMYTAHTTERYVISATADLLFNAQWQLPVQRPDERQRQFYLQPLCQPAGHHPQYAQHEHRTAAEIFRKNFIVTINVIDPFRQQQNKNFTYGSNFSLESSSTTQTKELPRSPELPVQENAEEKQ